jgi:hypothetical protein
MDGKLIVNISIISKAYSCDYKSKRKKGGTSSASNLVAGAVWAKKQSLQHLYVHI